MSYPSLGCFAECLECELCDGDDDGGDAGDGDGGDAGDGDIDLDIGDYEPGNSWDDPGHWEPEPDDYPDDRDLFDDFPTGIPIGDTEISPSWSNGPGLNWSGEF